MRISGILILGSCVLGQLLLAQVASAQAVTATKREAHKPGIEAAVQTSYLRSAADVDSAYYQSVATAEINLTLVLPTEGSVSLSGGVARNLDALEEQNLWSATSLTFAQPFELASDLKLTVSSTAVLPTNNVDRDYLGYQGTFAVGAGISRTWHPGLVQSIRLGANTSGARNFFKYDSSQAGAPNTLVKLAASGNGSIALNSIFSVDASYGMRKVQKANSTWKDYAYYQRVETTAQVTDRVALSLSAGTENRAFSYDSETVQFALYDFQATVYEAAATFNF